MEGAQQGRGTDNAHQDDVYLKPARRGIAGAIKSPVARPTESAEGSRPHHQSDRCENIHVLGALWRQVANFSAMRSHTSERPAVNDRLSPPIKALRRSHRHRRLRQPLSNRFSKTRNVECLSASRSGKHHPSPEMESCRDTVSKRECEEVRDLLSCHLQVDYAWAQGGSGPSCATCSGGRQGRRERCRSSRARTSGRAEASTLVRHRVSSCTTSMRREWKLRAPWRAACRML